MVSIGYGITINGVHTFNEWGLRVVNREITQPQRIINRIQIPFTNDFMLLNSDTSSFERREMAYTFWLGGGSKTDRLLRAYNISQQITEMGVQMNIRDQMVETATTGITNYVGDLATPIAINERKGHVLMTMVFTIEPELRTASGRVIR
jgi:hypothetical protein